MNGIRIIHKILFKRAHRDSNNLVYFNENSSNISLDIDHNKSDCKKYKSLQNRKDEKIDFVNPVNSSLYRLPFDLQIDSNKSGIFVENKNSDKSNIEEQRMNKIWNYYKKRELVNKTKKDINVKSGKLFELTKNKFKNENINNSKILREVKIQNGKGKEKFPERLVLNKKATKIRLIRQNGIKIMFQGNIVVNNETTKRNSTKIRLYSTNIMNSTTKIIPTSTEKFITSLPNNTLISDFSTTKSGTSAESITKNNYISTKSKIDGKTMSSTTNGSMIAKYSEDSNPAYSSQKTILMEYTDNKFSFMPATDEFKTTKPSIITTQRVIIRDGTMGNNSTVTSMDKTLLQSYITKEFLSNVTFPTLSMNNMSTETITFLNDINKSLNSPISSETILTEKFTEQNTQILKETVYGGLKSQTEYSYIFMMITAEQSSIYDREYIDKTSSGKLSSATSYMIETNIPHTKNSNSNKESLFVFPLSPSLLKLSLSNTSKENTAETSTTYQGQSITFPSLTSEKIPSIILTVNQEYQTNNKAILLPIYSKNPKTSYSDISQTFFTFSILPLPKFRVSSSEEKITANNSSSSLNSLSTNTFSELPTPTTSKRFISQNTHISYTKEANISTPEMFSSVYNFSPITNIPQLLYSDSSSFETNILKQNISEFLSNLSSDALINFSNSTKFYIYSLSIKSSTQSIQGYQTKIRSIPKIFDTLSPLFSSSNFNLTFETPLPPSLIQFSENLSSETDVKSTFSKRVSVNSMTRQTFVTQTAPLETISSSTQSFSQTSRSSTFSVSSPIVYFTSNSELMSSNFDLTFATPLLPSLLMFSITTSKESTTNVLSTLPLIRSSFYFSTSSTSVTSKSFSRYSNQVTIMSTPEFTITTQGNGDYSSISMQTPDPFTQPIIMNFTIPEIISLPEPFTTNLVSDLSPEGTSIYLYTSTSSKISSELSLISPTFMSNSEVTPSIYFSKVSNLMGSVETSSNIGFSIFTLSLILPLTPTIPDEGTTLTNTSSLKSNSSSDRIIKFTSKLTKPLESSFISPVASLIPTLQTLTSDVSLPNMTSNETVLLSSLLSTETTSLYNSSLTRTNKTIKNNTLTDRNGTVFGSSSSVTSTTNTNIFTTTSTSIIIGIGGRGSNIIVIIISVLTAILIISIIGIIFMVIISLVKRIKIRMPLRSSPELESIGAVLNAHPAPSNGAPIDTWIF